MCVNAEQPGAVEQFGENVLVCDNSEKNEYFSGFVPDIPQSRSLGSGISHLPGALCHLPF